MTEGLVLAALVVVAGTLGRTGWAGPLVLIGLSVLWLLVNKSMEGEVIWVVSRGRGVTSADLAGLAGLAVAVGRLVVLRRAANG